MRIVHLTDYFQPSLGYQETFLAKQQKLNGHEVLVVTSDRYAPFPNYKSTVEPILGQRFLKPGRFLEEGIEVVRMKTSFEISNRAFFSGVNFLLSSIRPDVVHAHNVMKFTTLSAVLAKRRLGCCLVVDDHQHPIDVRQDIFGQWFYRCFRMLASNFFAGRVDKFVGVTTEITESMSTLYGIKKCKLETVELGVDVEQFRFCDESRKEVRNSLGISEEAFLVIYTGKVIEEKGIHILYEAISKLGGKVVGMIVGNATNDYESFLSEKAVALGIESNIKRVKAVTQRELPRYFSAADVACWPKGVSISTLEAASCGLPLVIAKGTVASRVSEGNGFEYELGNIEDLLSKLKSFVESPERTKLFGQRSRKMVLNNYSWPKINSKFMQIYQSCLQDRKNF
jgi:glycosyltransferase involved in cell wall biosynthesis